MFVERMGRGPVHLLGVHGWSGDHQTFAPLTKNLPEDFTFWSVDLPGCGQSPPPSTWTLRAIVNELGEVIRGVGAPVQLIGNCSGALLAFCAAKTMGSSPEWIARIVSIDAFAWWPWYFRVFLAPGWGRYAYMTAFANPIGRWIANISLAKKRSETTDLTAGFARVDHGITYSYLQVLRELSGIEEIRGVECPVDLCYGERSFAAVRDSAIRLRQVLPQARSVMLRGAGHLPIAEATSQLRQLIFEENPCLDPLTKRAR